MARKDDGGSFAPIGSPEDFLNSERGHTGLSLRDWFASHAPEPPRWWLEEYAGCHDKADDLRTAAQHIAQWRFAFADAMLAARNTDAPKPDGPG